jgi:group I intron endonuclease
MLQNLVNGKVYVGQTKSPPKRKATHFYNARRGIARPLYAAIRKYGVENFSFEVLEECIDEVVNDREQHWVAHFDSFNPEKGYNLTNGGNQLLEFSEEVVQRMRDHHVGMKGRHHTDEAKRKIREARLRCTEPTEETRQKLSAAAKTRKGERSAMFGRRGENSPLFGRKHTVESRQKMSQARKLYWQRRRENS